jgi:hypothetical protein
MQHRHGTDSALRVSLLVQVKKEHPPQPSQPPPGTPAPPPGGGHPPGGNPATAAPRLTPLRPQPDHRASLHALAQASGTELGVGDS